MPDVLCIRFCNEKVRVLADELVTCYETVRAFNEQWDAHNMGKILEPTGERLPDGSEIDGRPPLTGEDAHSLRKQVGELQVWFEDGERILAFRRVAVNGAGRL